MATLEQRQEKILKEFSHLQDWDSKYKKIIEMGKSLPAFPEQHRTDDNKVKGCQSQVWLFAELNQNGNVVFQGDSDALIVKGLVALLLELYTDLGPDEILAGSPEFFKTLGLNSQLSPSRSNGLSSMFKQIRNYALAFKIMLQSKNNL